MAEISGLPHWTPISGGSSEALLPIFGSPRSFLWLAEGIRPCYGLVVVYPHVGGLGLVDEQLFSEDEAYHADRISLL